MFHADAVALPGLAALAAGLLLFVVALLVARRGRRDDAGETGATRSSAATTGIAVQALGLGAVAVGPQRVVLDPLSIAALVDALAVALLMLAATALFTWASRTMGRNWSIRARTRADHQLVETGPFAHVRHPIYVAIALLLPAIAVATGHAKQLAMGIPLYVVGTLIRTRTEERLLRARFPEAYPAYAARVRAFIPGVI